MAEISDPVGQQAREKEGGAAEEEEIEHRPQPHGDDHKDPQPPSGGHGVDEKGGGEQEPKEEIQDGAQQGEVEPAPEDPHKVVDQARSHAQGRRPGKGKSLVPQVDAHPTGTAGQRTRPGPRHRPHR